jgi:MFS family permease
VKAEEDQPGPPSRIEPWRRFDRRGLGSGLTAFRHRNYRLFWSGQLISLVGTWMQSVAQSWLILQLTDSAFQVGLVMALQFAPVLLLGMVGGVFADRRDKRRTILMTQAASALQATVLGVLIVTGRVHVVHVMLLAAALGVINAFDMPARQAFVVEMVGREDLMNAIALNSSAFNMARIVGPAIGGVLVAKLGVGPVYLLNGASYLAVIVGLLLIREEHLQSRPVPERQGVWTSLKSGLHYVRGQPLVQAAIFIVGAVSTVGMNFTVILSVMAKDVLRIGSSGFGGLMSALGIGSVLAALFLAFRSRLDPTRTMLLGAAGMAVAEILFVLTPSLHFLPLSFFFLLVVGFFAITLTATANNAIQQRVPDQLRGRVMAVYATVFAGSTPLGSLFSGWIARKWGAQWSMGVGAVLCGVAVLWAWLHLRRAVERPAAVA